MDCQHRAGGFVHGCVDRPAGARSFHVQSWPCPSFSASYMALQIEQKASTTSRAARILVAQMRFCGQGHGGVDATGPPLLMGGTGKAGTKPAPDPASTSCFDATKEPPSVFGDAMQQEPDLMPLASDHNQEAPGHTEPPGLVKMFACPPAFNSRVAPSPRSDLPGGTRTILTPDEHVTVHQQALAILDQLPFSSGRPEQTCLSQGRRSVRRISSDILNATTSVQIPAVHPISTNDQRKARARNRSSLLTHGLGRCIAEAKESAICQREPQADAAEADLEHQLPHMSSLHEQSDGLSAAAVHHSGSIPSHTMDNHMSSLPAIPQQTAVHVLGSELSSAPADQMLDALVLDCLWQSSGAAHTEWNRAANASPSSGATSGCGQDHHKHVVAMGASAHSYIGGDGDSVEVSSYIPMQAGSPPTPVEAYSTGRSCFEVCCTFDICCVTGEGNGHFCNRNALQLLSMAGQHSCTSYRVCSQSRLRRIGAAHRIWTAAVWHWRWAKMAPGRAATPMQSAATPVMLARLGKHGRNLIQTEKHLGSG